MRYAKIRKMDISNGKGIGVSLFVQGCEFHCQGCFNSETWNFDGGKEFTEETIDKIIELCKPEYIKRLSILGGEPFHPNNIGTVAEVCGEFKRHYPDKEIWIWTGYRIEQLCKRMSDFYSGNNITLDNAIKTMFVGGVADYIVDGRFEQDKKDLSLSYRGSSNQRILKRIDDFQWKDITDSIDKHL